MLKISEFSKITSVSARVLRHYDKIGLLLPSSIDEDSGYRYYSAEQIPIANKITALKNVGISLNDIKHILLERIEISQYLEVHKQLLESELAEKRLQIALLALIDEKNDSLQYPVEIKTMATIYVLSLKQVVTSYFEEENLWNILVAKIENRHKKELGPSLSIFHKLPSGQLEIEVMIGIPNHLKEKYCFAKPFSPGLVASVVTNGAYQSISKVHDSIEDWLKINEYVLSGNIFNIYHISPATEEKEKGYITEVCYPIALKSK